MGLKVSGLLHPDHTSKICNLYIRLFLKKNKGFGKKRKIMRHLYDTPEKTITEKQRETKDPFWKTTPLNEMSQTQWESLCDGCGRCCLKKFIDGKTGKVYYTNVACYLLDIESCRCLFYEKRFEYTISCLELTADYAASLKWLPKTCAYRRVALGKDLLWWHPLVSGDPETVHEAGISIRELAVPEQYVHPDDVENHIVPSLR